LNYDVYIDMRHVFNMSCHLLTPVTRIHSFRVKIPVTTRTRVQVEVHVLLKLDTFRYNLISYNYLFYTFVYLTNAFQIFTTWNSTRP